MTEQKPTPGPWLFEQAESAKELARLKGETLAEHEGYYRTNSGGWIVTYRGKAEEDDFEVGGPVCEVNFKGSAKRGQTHNAPDPEGMANARLIAASPDLLEALDDLASFIKAHVPLLRDNPLIEDADAALAKAKAA